MKRNAIIRIILYSLALVVLLGILGVCLGIRLFMVDGIHIDGGKIITEGSIEGSAEGVSTGIGDTLPQISEGDTVSTVLDTSDIREIRVDWAAGNITIISDELTTQITVMEPKVVEEKYQMRCFVKDNTLHIEYCQPHIGISLDRIDAPKDLMIIVPADWQCDELSIDSAAASVTIRDLFLVDVEINAASGVCNFENCTVMNLDVETASGDVTFSGALNHLDFEAMSANCHLTLGNEPMTIDVESMSGDLTLELPEDTGFVVSLDALSGDFTTDFDTFLQDGKHVHGSGGCRINLSALSGDVTIRKNAFHIHTHACDAIDSTCPYKHN